VVLEGLGLPTAVSSGKKSILSGISKFITSAASIASELLSGIASGDRGQIVSSIGRVIGQFGGPIGQAIGAVVETVGGVISFFGARARQKTKEMGEEISKGIQELKDAISSGAVSLGQGINQLRAEVEEARRRLAGRKGGREELERIEEDANAEIARLRAQARQIQDDFREQLRLLRVPKELRDVTQQINQIRETVKKFLESFENPEDALGAIEKAQEFIRRSIQEIEDEIKKSLASLEEELRRSVEQYELDRRAILLEGRLDPRVSEIENKHRRLIELDREFRERAKDLQSQIDAERQKLEFVREREKLEERAALWGQRAADALGGAAAQLRDAANALERAFDRMARLPLSGGALQAPASVNITIHAGSASADQIGISVAEHLRMSRQVNPSQLYQFNRKRS
jgi:hypothetical protein